MWALATASSDEFVAHLDGIDALGTQTLMAAGNATFKYDLPPSPPDFAVVRSKIPGETELTTYAQNYVADAFFAARLRVLAWTYQCWHGERYEVPEKRSSRLRRTDIRAPDGSISKFRRPWRLTIAAADSRSCGERPMAVYEGVVRAVYEIEAWHPAGSTSYKTRDASTLRREGRWEFTGRLASQPIHSLYLGRSVSAYPRPGLQNPVVYVNCPVRRAS